MIYFLDPNHATEDVIETNEYRDLNEQLWRIIVSESVIYVRYFGDWAHNQTHFVFLL